MNFFSPVIPGIYTCPKSPSPPENGFEWTPLVLEFGIVSEKVIDGFDDEYGVVKWTIVLGPTGEWRMMLGPILFCLVQVKKKF